MLEVFKKLNINNFPSVLVPSIMSLITNKPIVVAIDFGTSFSGIAFAHISDPKSVIFSAPSAEPGQVKVPTSLLRLSDGNWLFGNEAERRYYQELMKHIHQRGQAPAEKYTSLQFFKGYKLKLKDLNGSQSLDSVTVSAMNGEEQSLLTLVFLSLWFLKNHALERIRKSGIISQLENVENSIQWVVTIPAIWNDFAKSFMRKAAVIAGLIHCDDSSNLILALEPECAAIACHLGSSISSKELFNQEGRRCLVVDCGGGTIDLALCEVQSLSPFQLSVVQSPQGKEVGGEEINLSFKCLLHDLLKDTFNSESTLPLAFHNILREFERFKCRCKLYCTNEDDDSNDLEECIVNLREVLDDPQELVSLIDEFNSSFHDGEGVRLPQGPENDNGYLRLGKEIMSFLINPTLESIRQEIIQSMKTTPTCDYILLVGGFGSSDIVFNAMKKSFSDRISIFAPPIFPTPQAAILKGAVLYGFQSSSIISTRVARHTYGIKMYPDRFRKIVSVGELLPEGHEVEIWGIPVYPDQFTIEWKVLVTSKVDPIYAHEALELGKVMAYCPPGDDIRERKQKIKLKFGGTEITTEIVNMEGTTYFGKISTK